MKEIIISDNVPENWKLSNRQPDQIPEELVTRTQERLIVGIREDLTELRSRKTRTSWGGQA